MTNTRAFRRAANGGSVQAALAFPKAGGRSLFVTDDLTCNVEIPFIRPVGYRFANADFFALVVQSRGQRRMAVLEQPRIGLGRDDG